MFRNFKTVLASDVTTGMLLKEDAFDGSSSKTIEITEVVASSDVVSITLKNGMQIDFSPFDALFIRK